VTDPAASPTPPRIAAIVPVGSLGGAKSRLGGWLDAEERQELVEGFLARTLAVVLELQAAGRLADVLVVSPDRDVLAYASLSGARTLRQRTRGLNPGLVEARDDVAAGGADAVLVLPIDLPFISPDAVRTVCDGLDGSPTAVVLVTDRHGTGTNALGLRPPSVIPFAFGSASREAHRAAAAAAGATYVELQSPLALDLDTAEDLLIVESAAPERLGVA
jgi:2-phospho-L-lactate/phosphoenolpyruvate guanylyltransferase